MIIEFFKEIIDDLAVLIFKKQLERLDDTHWNSDKYIQTTYFLNIPIKQKLIIIPTFPHNYVEIFPNEEKHRNLIKKKLTY